MSSPNPEAEELKARGNALYQRAKWGAAIDAYTDAILIAPRWLPVLLNRALCHLKRKNWNAVREDCLKALDIDRESIKANYMLGLSLIAARNYREASMSLQKALEHARASGATIKDEIWRELARANYLQWELDAAERATRLENVRSKLLRLGVMRDEDAHARDEDTREDVRDAVIDLVRDDDAADATMDDAFGRRTREDEDATKKKTRVRRRGPADARGDVRSFPRARLEDARPSRLFLLRVDVRGVP